MSKNTTPPQSPKQGTVAAAHQRISELEAKLKEPSRCGCKIPELVPQVRQYTGRLGLPAIGVAMPNSHVFHQYVSVRLEDELIDDQLTPPTEEDVLELLNAAAQETYPNYISLEIADISVLPEGWA